ncbi:hypothetical protein PR048_012174 [Dryococelus australis]|uniref:Uncharacterized protein n=1 Tax=Dryococelus australis TaxID=614101 RepID=A0ABQ9HPW6_9NEOP|nr:hypothetical protein PR048_012174 [Dryococelus australis]
MNIAAEQMVQKRCAKKFSSVLKEASLKNDDDTMAIAFDDMQNQLLSLIPVQEGYENCRLMYYVLRLKIYFWSYIQNRLPSSVKNLLLLSDEAPGRNNKNTVVRFLINSCETGIFKRTQHFLQYVTIPFFHTIGIFDPSNDQAETWTAYTR